MNYHIYINSPEWKELGKRIKKRDGNECLICCSRKRLNVHHGTYERLGKELDEDLFTLCERCHVLLHKKREKQPLLDYTKIFIERQKRRFEKLKIKKDLRKRRRKGAFTGLLMSLAKKKNWKKEEYTPFIYKSKAHKIMEATKKKRKERRQRRAERKRAMKQENR